ncbi:MAG: hypothetical protein J6S85_25170 [Methanobrevibacter sp.]|nr:hypothetical protein [Methanobrevibacter sp.]
MFADRFPNRNFVSMEDASTIYIRNAKGDVLETLESLERPDHHQFILVENRSEHHSKERPKFIRLTDEEIKDLIRYMKTHKETHIPDSILEKIYSKRTGYKYPPKSKYTYSSSTSYSGEWSAADKVFVAMSLGIPVARLTWDMYKHFKEKHRRKKRKKK